MIRFSIDWSLFALPSDVCSYTDAIILSLNLLKMDWSISYLFWTLSHIRFSRLNRIAGQRTFWASTTLRTKFTSSTTIWHLLIASTFLLKISIYVIKYNILYSVTKTRRFIRKLISLHLDHASSRFGPHLMENLSFFIPILAKLVGLKVKTTYGILLMIKVWYHTITWRNFGFL